MKSVPLLFVSFKDFLEAEIPGGVQVCTKEYIELFNTGGFEVHVEPIPFTRNLLKRAKLKFGLDVYEGHDFKTVAESIIASIREKNIKIVALNQVSLIGLTPFLRKVFGNSIKIVVLSHGNESGDFLHEIVLEKKNSVYTALKRWRLGAFLTKESAHFRNDVDAVLCLSETEQQINNWLGAKRTFFIPRTYNPRFLPWKPVQGRVGFVGTLNHLPNYQGLVLYLEELRKLATKDVCVRIVGGPSEVGMDLQEKFPFVEYVGKLDATSLESEAATWSLFLNPVFWYSRGASTKLAQGINWGLPIITTPAGNRGYTVSNGQLITVFSPKEMAEKSVQFLANPEWLNEQAAATRSIAVNGPTYDQITDLIMPVILYS